MVSHVREKQWNENIFEHGKQTLAWKSCRLGVHTSNGSVLKTYLINNVSLSRTQRRDSYPIWKSCQTYHVLMWRWPKSCFRACIESSINKNPILFLIFRGLLFQCLSESNNYWEKSSTAVELPVAILLIVLYELPLASLHLPTYSTIESTRYIFWKYFIWSSVNQILSSTKTDAYQWKHSNFFMQNISVSLIMWSSVFSPLFAHYCY